MSASKLKQGFPIFELLTPADADTASFGKPAQGALNHPAPGRITGFTGHGTGLNNWLPPSAAMFDVGNIARLLNKLMHIIVIIAFIRTQVLLFLLGAFDHNRDNQIIGRPFIMLVGSGDMKRQRRTPLIDQQMQFCPFLPRSVGLLPVSLPPRGAGQDLLSIACHFHLIVRRLW